MEIWLINLQHTSDLRAQPRLSHDNVFPINTFYLYVYLFVSDQSVFIGSELFISYIYKCALSLKHWIKHTDIIIYD